MRVAGLLRSFAFRLAMLHLAALLVTSALIVALMYWLVVERPLEVARATVEREARIAADIYILDGQAATIRALERRAAGRSPRRAFHALIAPDGAVVTANLPTWPRPSSGGWLRFEADQYRDGTESEYFVLAFDRTFRDGARLIVGRDIDDIDERDEVLREEIPWAIPVLLLFGIAGGVLLSRAVGRRIDALGHAARVVIAGDLSGRVQVSGSGDDFDRLGQTINLMLGRMQESMAAISRVSDSVAHELRTPLARLRADLETALDATPADREASLARAIGEAARLQNTFDALLRIARLETGRHVLVETEIDLVALLRDAAEFHEPPLAEAAVPLTLDLPDALPFRGDRDLLFQAISNLLDNAAKHAPGGGATLSAKVEGADVVIAVADTGPGVDPAHVDRLAERFHRAPASAATDGIGLGLTLVAAVARAHGGCLVAVNQAPGLAVALRLPRR